MTDKNLTNNETIKALEGAILNAKRCDSKVWSIEIYKLENALDLITRQQAENETLKALNGRLVVLSDRFRSELKTAKAEAYKECVEKVKNYIKTHCNPYGKPDFDYDTSIKILNFIDNLVKEMVVDNSNDK